MDFAPSEWSTVPPAQRAWLGYGGPFALVFDLRPV